MDRLGDNNSHPDSVANKRCNIELQLAIIGI